MTENQNNCTSVRIDSQILDQITILCKQAGITRAHLLDALLNWFNQNHDPIQAREWFNKHAPIRQIEQSDN